MRSFEDSLNAHKSELTEALIVFGEHKRVNKVLAEVEMQRPDFYKFYKEGLESRQTEVDELKLQVAEMKSRLNDAYTDGQSAMYAARQTKVDELQKKITELKEIINENNKHD